MSTLSVSRGNDDHILEASNARSFYGEDALPSQFTLVDMRRSAFPDIGDDLAAEISRRELAPSPQAELRVGAKWVILAIEDLEDLIGYATELRGPFAFKWKRVVLPRGRGDSISRIRRALSDPKTPTIPYEDVRAEAVALDAAAPAGNERLVSFLEGAAERALREVRQAETDPVYKHRKAKIRKHLERLEEQIAAAQSGSKVATWPLQRALIRQLRLGRDIALICEDMVGEISRPNFGDLVEVEAAIEPRDLARSIGLVKPRGRNGTGNRLRATTYERAARICIACRAEPSECGV